MVVKQKVGRPSITRGGVFGEIGQRVRAIRAKSGMSAQRAAEATGGVVSPKAWYDLERGQGGAGLFKFLAAAMALGVPLPKLLGGEIGDAVANIRGPVPAQEIARLLAHGDSEAE